MIGDTATRFRPPPLALRSELIEAAENHGYRRHKGDADGWLFFASDIGVPGEIALAVGGGIRGEEAWFLAVEHAGVARELGAPSAGPAPGACRAAFVFDTGRALREALHRAYQLAESLPTLPLARFEEEVRHLGATEAERIVRQRIGQGIFRDALMRYWDGRCPLTGIGDTALLRASHIIPWAMCDSDAERLDVHNGLLLSAHWDAAFDAGLVGFDDAGRAIVSPALGAEACAVLAPRDAPSLALTDAHRARLAWHRAHYQLEDA